MRSPRVLLDQFNTFDRSIRGTNDREHLNTSFTRLLRAFRRSSIQIRCYKITSSRSINFARGPRSRLCRRDLFFFYSSPIVGGLVSFFFSHRSSHFIFPSSSPYFETIRYPRVPFILMTSSKRVHRTAIDTRFILRSTNDDFPSNET